MDDWTKIKNFSVLLAVSAVLITGFVLPAPLFALDIEEILRKADRARGNFEGIVWVVSLESVRKHRTRSLELKVNSRGFDLSAQYLAPPRSKGNQLLMVNGNMWFYKRGLTKPVPISRRQKLMGRAANGDIAATNYANDYEATLMGEEMVDGELCYKFDLKSKDKKTTYDRIMYWVSKERVVGVQADYFTVSDKRFKSARMEYNNKVGADGQPFVSKLTIYDRVASKDVTTLDFSEPTLEKLPDYLFDLNLLRK